MPRADGPTTQEPRRLIPIAAYTLAVSWSPEFCHGRADQSAYAFQCGAGKHFGWVLHGLWPDGAGKDWPQYCHTVGLLPEPVLRTNLCTTPSVQLLQHEWAKHGSCMAASPDTYFKQANAVYARLKFPDMAALAARRDVTAGSFAAAFARVNPGMTPDMMRVTANKGGWLDELWFCPDKNLRFGRCRTDRGGVPASTRLKIARPI